MVTNRNVSAIFGVVDHFYQLLISPNSILPDFLLLLKINLRFRNTGLFVFILIINIFYKYTYIDLRYIYFTTTKQKMYNKTK